MALTGDILTYEPEEKQKQFHRSEARVRVFRGANRSGKTIAGAAEVVMVALGFSPVRSPNRIPIPSRIWLVALDFQVSSNVMEPMVRRLLPKKMIMEEDPRERRIKLINGVELFFKSCDQSPEKFQSDSVNFVWLDERPPQPIYKEVLTRTIDVKGDIIMTFTPIHGEDWTYEEMYIPWSEGKVSRDSRGYPDIDFIEVSIHDNEKYITSDEVERASRSYSSAEREIRLEGRYASLEGAVFPEWDSAVHVCRDVNHLPEQGIISDWWELTIGMDHGSGQGHTAAYLLARRDDGVVLVVREYYQPVGVRVESHADALRLMCSGLPRMPVIYLDPSARQVGIELEGLGLVVARANNDRRLGFSRIREALFHEPGSQPRLIVYPGVRHLVRDIPHYSWKPNTNLSDGQDIVKKKWDHSIDAFRYGLMALPKSSYSKPRDVGKTPEQKVESYLESLRKKRGENGRDFLEYGFDGLG